LAIVKIGSNKSRQEGAVGPTKNGQQKEGKVPQGKKWKWGEEAANFFDDSCFRHSAEAEKTPFGKMARNEKKICPEGILERKGKVGHKKEAKPKELIDENEWKGEWAKSGEIMKLGKGILDHFIMAENIKMGELGTPFLEGT
jgi:hypothetical protein